MTLAEHPRGAPPDLPGEGTGAAGVAVVRTGGGWAVVSPEGAERVADLVEGLCLADLVAEHFGGSVDPDRSARRSARGPVPSSDTALQDPREARLAALERTVAQLEHALAARVSTERAIGVLAERHATTPREAFEALRQSARSQGRAVVELAREVLDTLTGETAPHPDAAGEAAGPAGGAGTQQPADPSCPALRSGPPAAADSAGPRPPAGAARRPAGPGRAAPDGRS